MSHRNGDLCGPYVNKNGKRVTGTAAMLHQVFTVDGSVQDYNDKIGAEYVTEFIKQNSDIINDGLEKKARRRNLKVVGGNN